MEDDSRWSSSPLAQARVDPADASDPGSLVNDGEHIDIDKLLQVVQLRTGYAVSRRDPAIIYLVANDVLFREHVRILKDVTATNKDFHEALKVDVGARMGALEETIPALVTQAITGEARDDRRLLKVFAVGGALAILLALICIIILAINV